MRGSALALPDFNRPGAGEIVLEMWIAQSTNRGGWKSVADIMQL